MKKINIYNINQYTKTGKEKKNARAEISIYLTGRDWEQEGFVRHLKSIGYHNFTSPYMFTHIEALNGNNERVLIHERVIINGNEFITSPTSLYELLTK